MTIASILTILPPNSKPLPARWKKLERCGKKKRNARWTEKIPDLRIKSYVKKKLAKLAPAKYTLETVYGVVKPLKEPEDFKKLKQIAIKEHVKKITEEARKI